MDPKTFWKKQKKYPNYDYIKERRLHELNYLVPRLCHVNSLLDLGCGDGSLISCLSKLTEVKKYYAYDISKYLLKNVPNFAIKKEYDICSLQKLPKTEVTILGGVLIYILDDLIAFKALTNINSKILYLRNPVTFKKNRENIDTFSKQLNSRYIACYRTIPEILQLLKNWSVTEITRLYPDSIESKFNTKQFYFKCVRRK